MAKPQIFNRDMKRLAYLDNALAVGYGLETNSLWTATFTLPADDPKNAYCAPLNYVEIFDGDERIDLFRIIGEDLERSNGANIIDRVSDDSAFFKLQPGENDIIVEGGTTADVKILWKDRWL